MLGGYLRILGVLSVQSCSNLIDICFLACICLWQIQTFFGVAVEPGLVSTSHTIMRRSASHPAGPLGRIAPKTVNRAHILGVRRGRHNLHSGLPDRGDSSTACVCCVVWSNRCRISPFVPRNSHMTGQPTKKNKQLYVQYE